eukprot:8570843-Pyramimonas_sp.AAC.1
MGHSRKTPQKMASCKGAARHETLRTCMQGAFGATLEKKSDMICAVSCAKGVGTWLEKLDAAAEGGRVATGALCVRPRRARRACSRRATGRPRTWATSGPSRRRRAATPL